MASFSIRDARAIRIYGRRFVQTGEVIAFRLQEETTAFSFNGFTSGGPGDYLVVGVDSDDIRVVKKDVFESQHQQL